MPTRSLAKLARQRAPRRTPWLLRPLVDDYDGDGKPDLRFSSTGPARATVRMFDGTRYEASLPETALNDPEIDLCRPTPALAFAVRTGTKSKTVSPDEMPPKIRPALAAAYLPSAECPDAE